MGVKQFDSGPPLFPIMRCLWGLLLFACALIANAAEVVRVAPWELHSSFWMSLHQTLIADVSRSTPRDLTALSPEEQKTWKEAVAAYRASAEYGDMIFAKPIAITSDAITQIADDATEPLIGAPLADALNRTALIYRARWWYESVAPNDAPNCRWM